MPESHADANLKVSVRREVSPRYDTSDKLGLRAVFWEPVQGNLGG
jgi:hypothetical protein